MGFGNPNSCARITSYAAAKRHFELTPMPKTRSGRWSAYERPLDDNSKWHYRIEHREGDAFFDICLYHTRMARFFAPTADGSYRVQYTSYYSTLSRQFMCSVLHSGKERTETTPEGKSVVVPVSTSGETDLWYRADGRLIVEKSRHTVVKKLVVSDKIKAWRKELRKNTKTLLELLSLRLPELDTERYVSINRYNQPGKPFSSIESKYIHCVKMTGWDGTTELTEAAAAAILELYEACAEFIVDKRVYAQNPPSWVRKQVKERTPLTPSAVRSSVLRQLDGLFPHWGEREDSVPQPLFQETLPSHWRF